MFIVHKPPNLWCFVRAVLLGSLTLRSMIFIPTKHLLCDKLCAGNKKIQLCLVELVF